jgi:hypothetical protein
VAPNANAPAAFVAVVVTLPDESTRVSIADPMPAVVPACTTCPVNPYVAFESVDEDVVDGVTPVEWVHASAHAADRTTHKKTVRSDMVSFEDVART